MVAADLATAQHVTGSAVGGGTLQGLGGLLLGTNEAVVIDQLAANGDANKVDLTLDEAIGGTVGSLPVDANAVNFGKLSMQMAQASREDIAAGLVRLIAQVIAVIAINAAAAAEMEDIVYTGHLIDLPQIRLELHTTAGYYQKRFTLPDSPGTGTVQGALSWALYPTLKA